MRTFFDILDNIAWQERGREPQLREPGAETVEYYRATAYSTGTKNTYRIRSGLSEAQENILANRRKRHEKDKEDEDYQKGYEIGLLDGLAAAVSHEAVTVSGSVNVIDDLIKQLIGKKKTR